MVDSAVLTGDKQRRVNATLRDHGHDERHVQWDTLTASPPYYLAWRNLKKIGRSATFDFK